jgi:FdhD protein
MPPNDVARAILPARATCLSFSGAAPQGVERALPVETPVAIVYAPTPYAVMMASPMDIEDFAYGFSLTEGVIETAADIRAIDVAPDERGLRLTITLASDRLKAHLARARNMAGRTGCGVCGVEDLDHLPFAPVVPRDCPPLSMAAARRAVRALDAMTPLGDLTRATHAAAWCDEAGEILFVREDVGRHNALDKLIGALMRGGVDPARGFVLVTSRCSFEMVEKTAALGARAIVAISAPTSLAVERARAHGMTMLAIARADGALLFTEGADVEHDLTLEGAPSA